MKLGLWSLRTLKLQWSCVARHLCWSPGVQPQGHCNREIGVEMSQYIHSQAHKIRMQTIQILLYFYLLCVFGLLGLLCLCLCFLCVLSLWLNFLQATSLASWLLDNESGHMRDTVWILSIVYRHRYTQMPPAFNKAIIPHYKVFTQLSSLRLTQHQIHFYNMKLTFALHEILLTRSNEGYIPLPHTPLIDLGSFIAFIAIHCDSWFMGHIGPHWATSIELCAVRLLSPPT